MAEDKNQAERDLWEPFRYFLGTWKGTGTGKPGESRAEREYSLVLNDRFIRMDGRSVYEPQAKNPEGEIHEEMGLFSYDEARESYVLREFHVEGYVNQYLLESLDRERGVLVLATEAIENIAPGWQARTTYEILDEDHFRETFDLAGPGKPWACYIINEFERQ